MLSPPSAAALLLRWWLVFRIFAGVSQRLVVCNVVLFALDKFFVRGRFYVHEQIVGLRRRSDQLVKFQLGGHLNAILRVLNHEQHYQRDRRRSRREACLLTPRETKDSEKNAERHDDQRHTGRHAGSRGGVANPVQDPTDSTLSY